MRAEEHTLLVITGPVGAGKSTTAQALAQALRTAQRPVAVIDLDLMYGFLRQKPGYGEPTAWARARAGAAALANAFFSMQVPLVIVEGEFFNQEELGMLLAPLAPTTQRHVFTLRLPYAQVLEQVQGDPTRGASKDPVFLRSLHDHFLQALPFLATASTVIDTEGLALPEVVARLLGALGSDRLPVS